MTQVDKISRDDLRALHDGETRTFQLPSAAAVESGKTSAYIFAKLAGIRLRCESDFENKTLTITRYDH
ncbi:MAG: hypothetical protein IJI97_03005 [Clostridia bacterium]|nr:hypothetical protein [Clostridia bacterium]